MATCSLVLMLTHLVFAKALCFTALPRRSVRNVTMVDIDYEVTRFSLEWMPTLSNGSFKDPRLKVVTGPSDARP